MEANSTILIKGGGILASSSIMADMVIFTDPAYMLLSVVGATLSLFGMLHEIFFTARRNKIYFTITSIFAQLGKALVLGGILTPMYFMLFLHTGGSIMSQIVGLDGLDGIFNSFWWLASLLTSWYSPVVWDGFLNKVKKRVKRGE